MNISLFDVDYHSKTPNKCEVNHFHIYIEGDLQWPFAYNDVHMKGVFMHEYIHYVQHLSTLCGISIARQYNLLFCNYRAFFADNDIIPIPLSWDMVAPEMGSFFTSFNLVKGDKEFGGRIDKIHVDEKEIRDARKERRSVKLDIYDEESDDWVRKGLAFGYYAIIESMADMIQRIYEPNVEHDDVPYRVVQKLCESYFPEVAYDNRMMISLCLCALMASNPGCGFFEAVDFAREHRDLDGYELYNAFVIDSTIILKSGKEVTIAEWFEHQLSEYDKTIEQALGISDYYCEAIRNSLKCAQTGENLLLVILYDKNVSPDDYFQSLINFYGAPYIESYNLTLYPGRESMPIDVVAAIGLEIIYKNISNNHTTNCARIEQCTRNRSNSYDCVNGNQWYRDSQCPFGAAKHYFGVDNKTFEMHKK